MIKYVVATTFILFARISALEHTQPNIRKASQLHKKLPVRKQLKTSLIIPCYYKHTQHLYDLLKQYEQQTVLPDEVIIAVSEANNVNPAELQAIQGENWAFPVTMSTTNEVQYAGQNRNTACCLARGDILILQDADDIPHPQRIEIIKYFFEQYDVDHLMHQYVTSREMATQNDALQFIDALRHIKPLWPNYYLIADRVPCIHNGNIAISKELFAKLQWSGKQRGQDEEFNRRAYEQTKNCVVIRVPLLTYRSYLSSDQQNAKSLTTSLIIPCHYKHVPYLYGLLRLYEQQTILPDEIVIAISEIDKVDPIAIHALQAEKWSFPVYISTTCEIQYPGQNRNSACQLAKGDIFIMQDADDIPHPQRVEIIKYFFEHHDIDHLMHQLFLDHGPNRLQGDFPPIDTMQDISFERPTQYCDAEKFNIHNGNIAISKDLFAAFHWSDKRFGEDVEFNRNVYGRGEKSIVIKAPLLLYRIMLSSTRM